MKNADVSIFKTIEPEYETPIMKKYYFTLFWELVYATARWQAQFVCSLFLKINVNVKVKLKKHTSLLEEPAFGMSF